jgi:hypothetical protein
MTILGRNLGRNLGVLALAAALLAPGLGAAEEAAPPPCDRPGCGRMGGGRGGPGGARRFDPKAVTTIQGQIVDVQRIARGRGEGVHLTVAAGAERLAVQLGPSFFVDAQPFHLAKGDTVEVKGVRTTLGGEPAFLAQELKRGGDVLTLRDADGLPLWRGQGRGRR